MRLIENAFYICLYTINSRICHIFFVHKVIVFKIKHKAEQHGKQYENEYKGAHDAYGAYEQHQCRDRSRKAYYETENGYRTPLRFIKRARVFIVKSL